MKDIQVQLKELGHYDKGVMDVEMDEDFAAGMYDAVGVLCPMHAAPDAPVPYYCSECEQLTREGDNT